MHYVDFKSILYRLYPTRLATITGFYNLFTNSLTAFVRSSAYMYILSLGKRKILLCNILFLFNYSKSVLHYWRGVYDILTMLFYYFRWGIISIRVVIRDRYHIYSYMWKQHVIFCVCSVRLKFCSSCENVLFPVYKTTRFIRSVLMNVASLG